ncbi:hypothetical protein Tco_0796919 [Tanacetum coccineum]
MTTCHHCKEVGHCKRNCLTYLAELIKKKKQVGTTSSSDVFIIELFSFPTKSWVYDTSCGTHIYNTKHGLEGVRKAETKEAIRSFDLVLPNGLVNCLDNCHYEPSITRGVVSVHHLVENGFHCRLAHINLKGSINDDSSNSAIYPYGIMLLDLATRILNMVPTKKVVRLHMNYGMEKFLICLTQKVQGCEVLVKRDTPDKLQQRSVNGRAIDLEEIQDEDTSPSEITSEIPMEVEGFEPPHKPNNDIIFVYRSARIPQILD